MTTSTPKHLRPWSIVEDAELKALRELKSELETQLAEVPRDVWCFWLNTGAGQKFEFDRLRTILKKFYE